MVSQLFIDLMYQAGSYLGAMLLGFFIFNYLSNGFIWKYLVVKGSRGSKVMVEFVSVQRSYWRTGFVAEGVLTTKNSAKTVITQEVEPNDFRRLMAIDYIIIDEASNTILKADFTTKQRDNLNWFDNLLVRALEKPQIQNKISVILEWLARIIILIMLAYLIYKVGQIEALVKAIPTIGVIQ